MSLGCREKTDDDIEGIDGLGMNGGVGQEVKTLCLMLRDVFFKYHTPHGNFSLLTGGDERRGGRSLRDRLPNADVVFRVCVCL